MKLTLSYGSGTIDVTVPDSCTVDQFAPRSGDASLYDFECFVADSRGLLSQLRQAERLLLVVNDGFRGTPTRRVLAWLHAALGESLLNSDFLVATGTHVPPTDEHLAYIFGDFLDSVRSRVFVHDCRDDASLTELGLDRFGKPVKLNSRVLEDRPVLCISSVEPHYFAGYTGGRKSLFPGLADFDTVVRNHNMAASTDAAPLRLAGNPVAEHLDELAHMVDLSRILSIQLVTDVSGGVVKACCGNLIDSFAEACRVAERVFAHRVDQPFDLVLCEVHRPMDINLYQTQKALENNVSAVRDGGTIILLSECPEGVGSRHFFELASRWDREKNQAADGTRPFGSHKLSRVINHSRRIRPLVYSELDPADVEHVFYAACRDIQMEIHTICAANPAARIAVVADAAHTVLTTNNS